MAPKPNPEMDEKVALPLDPEEALQALLAVDPAGDAASERSDSVGPGE